MAIISFQHRFVFVKTRKTAGTSVEVELSRMIEPAAIVTPVLPPEPEHAPRNYKRGLLRKAYYNHMPAAQIRSFLGASMYEKMYVFGVERDPVAKCLSHYNMLVNSPFHRVANREEFTWDQYCDHGEFPIDIDKYAVREDARWRLLVDEVIPYETLKASLAQIGERVGLGPITLSSRAKSGYSQGPKARAEDVTAAQRVRILEAFAPSLQVTGLLHRYT